jgi:hypothetical protein
MLSLVQAKKAGEVKSWWTLSNPDRNIICQRIANVSFTREHGRSPKDITSLRGLMTMEDYFHFFESVGPLVFRDGILHAQVNPIISLLQFRVLICKIIGNVLICSIVFVPVCMGI